MPRIVPGRGMGRVLCYKTGVGNGESGIAKAAAPGFSPDSPFPIPGGRLCFTAWNYLESRSLNGGNPFLFRE